MNRYDRRMVKAPVWMENFICIAEKCTESCCQQWNIDVDPVHADCYTHLGDPELQSIMDSLLHRFHIRRAGMKKSELQYLFFLLSQPDKRCPLLDEAGKCRLQKKYGAEILCDTCYFHPRTFWQINEQTGMSACLSCPECARLALLHEEPTVISEFEAEIDPNAEWLETSLISDADTRMLMRHRDLMVHLMCDILQDRRFRFMQRMIRVKNFLFDLSNASSFDEKTIRSVFQRAFSAPETEENSADPEGLMDFYLDVFDPVSEACEKPVQGTSAVMRSLAGGTEGFVRLLADNYEKGCRIMSDFFADKAYLIENFMVHCVFSDSFKQFHRLQNDPVSVRNLLKHEAALLDCWYIFLQVLLAQAALEHGKMTEKVFLETIVRGDKNFWHYPDWFSRCADNAMLRDQLSV